MSLWKPAVYTGEKTAGSHRSETTRHRDRQTDRRMRKRAGENIFLHNKNEKIMAAVKMVNKSPF